MGACQIVQQVRATFLKKTRLSSCELTIGRLRAHRRGDIVTAEMGHIPNQIHTNIYTHAAACRFDTAHRAVTVSGPRVIEVTEAQTGWGCHQL